MYVTKLEKLESVMIDKLSKTDGQQNRHSVKMLEFKHNTLRPLLTQKIKELMRLTGKRKLLWNLLLGPRMHMTAGLSM
jgi:hypothetical protein